jgi:putative aldouronate transport system substrate-binding protein
VKKNDPGQVLTNETVNAGNFAGTFSATGVLDYKYSWANGTLYGLGSDYGKPSTLRTYWGSADFITDMKMFKVWADKGFWSRSALSAKNDPTSFPNGKAVVVMAGQNPNKFGKDTDIVLGAHADWKVGFIPYAVADGVAVPAHATQNGYGIPISSKNPERALMFFQKLLLDKTYHDLTQYGILGTHYNETAEGYYEGIGDPSKTGFGREGMNGWGWRNPNFMLFPKSFDVVKKVFADMDVIANKQPDYKGINIGGGFAEDYTSYQSERAALGTVLTQYLAPLEAGLVKDVDAAVKTFMDKANAAGLEKIQAEYTKQWTDYCTLYGYK